MTPDDGHDSRGSDSFGPAGSRDGRRPLLQELQSRISELLRSSPAADLERNLKALATQTFQRMDLVTREEFEIQTELLERLQQRVSELEAALQREQIR